MRTLKFANPLQTWLTTATLMMSAAAAACADTAPVRPNLKSAKAIARVPLQKMAAARAAPMMASNAVIFAAPAAADDPLGVYQHTLLGDWPSEASTDATDPWVRLLVLAPQRLLVVDVATFVDGKPYRSRREALIDDILSAAKTQTTHAAAADSPPSIPTALIADPAEKPESDASTDAVPEPAQVAAKARTAPTLRERAMAYVADAGASVTRDELRWLLAEWGTGPTALVLGKGLSWERAGVAPLWALLDRDSDGILAASELKDVAATLTRADADQDDIVDEREMQRAAKRAAVMPFSDAHPLLVMLAGEVDTDELAAQLREAYASRPGTASFDEAKLQELATQPADVTLRIDLGAGQPAEVAVVDAVSDLSAAVTASTAVNAISVDLGANIIEFSAVSGTGAEASDVAATQIAIGAVIDGNPLMRLVDRDQDHRLTRRERQDLAAILASLDRDGDGDIDADETPVPIRFAVTLGPHVHTLLATPAPAAASRAPRTTVAAAAPPWFQSMDKNGDRDLTRAEFLGTTDQFGTLDADGDGLVSTSEAAASTAQQ